MLEARRLSRLGCVYAAPLRSAAPPLYSPCGQGISIFAALIHSATKVARRLSRTCVRYAHRLLVPSSITAPVLSERAGVYVWE